MIKPIGNLTPWACMYWKEGKPYGITLWGDDPMQLLEDWCDRLENLSIEGVLIDDEDA